MMTVNWVLMRKSKKLEADVQSFLDVFYDNKSINAFTIHTGTARNKNEGGQNFFVMIKHMQIGKFNLCKLYPIAKFLR